MIIDAKKFLTKVEQICAEEPAYRKGGYGSDGTCDCIGLIIGAIRRAGGSWTGTHGSNYAARNEIKDLQRIQHVANLRVGDVVFKAHAPGEEGYDAQTINGKYAASPDKLDYYHVGVVVSVEPLRIRHMTTPRPKTDMAIGKWTHHGWLKKISTNGGGEANMADQEVVIGGGNLEQPVRMRSGPSTDRKIIAEIKQGSAGTLIEICDENWCKVQVGNRTGYIKKVFVTKVGEDLPGEVQGGDPNDVTLMIRRADLEAVYDLIGNLLGRRG